MSCTACGFRLVVRVHTPFGGVDTGWLTARPSVISPRASSVGWEKGDTMLGEQIAEEKGRVTARRVLSTDPARIEISAETQGSLLGVETKTIMSYVSQLRPDGSLYGEGEGVVMGKDGDTATWKGQGVGVFKENGAISYRGAVYYQSASTKLARLNSIACVFEYEVDADGSTSAKLYEWR